MTTRSTDITAYKPSNVSTEQTGTADEYQPATSSRLAKLAHQFRDKSFRDTYVVAHTRRFLARQMRKFRGSMSQTEFADFLGKKQTVVSRLENPNYTGWTLSTLFEVASKLNIAVFVRFVDFSTFLKYSDDQTAEAMRPEAYDDDFPIHDLSGNAFFVASNALSSAVLQTNFRYISSNLNSMAPNSLVPFLADTSDRGFRINVPSFASFARNTNAPNPEVEELKKQLAEERSRRMYAEEQNALLKSLVLSNAPFANTKTTTAVSMSDEILPPIQQQQYRVLPI